MFFKKALAGVDFLIIGLGNPGKKYEGTRHNVGFEALEHAARTWGISMNKSKFDALVGSGTVAGKKVLLAKPQTFMNCSGQSVQKAAAFYKVAPEHIVVLCDDVSLPCGAVRLRAEGSAGGHNGLKSIIAAMGQVFPRVKIGVGAKPHPDYDLADWVLGSPTQTESKAITARYDDICAALELTIQEQFSTAQSKYNK